MSEEKKLETCNICCGEKSRLISCNYCKFEACDSCQEKFLLSQTNPKCMSCKKDWSNEFIYLNFSKNFINKKYKKHKENILFELEKALLPHTQLELVRKNNLRELKNRIHEQKAILRDLEYQYDHLRYRTINGYNDKEEEKTKNEDIKQCPDETCRGYLSKNEEKKDVLDCGLCNKRVCKHCFETLNKDEHKIEHKCDEQLLETIKLIKRECRGCPKCNTLIYKISGCDMMFCTQCKTAFSWKTGEIASGPIHNPHYFEYLATVGEDDREIFRRFGGDQVFNIEQINENNIYCVDFYNLLREMQIKCRNIDMVKEITEFGRYILHVEHVERNNTFRIQNLEDKNADIREAYLNKEIDEKKFQSLIYRRNKRHEFVRDVNLLLDMFITVCKEEFCKLFLYLKKRIKLDKRIIHIEKENEYSQFIDKVERLQKYTRENYERLCTRYDYKYSLLDAINPHYVDVLKPKKPYK